jgi:hypothetical protein
MKPWGDVLSKLVQPAINSLTSKMPDNAMGWLMRGAGNFFGKQVTTWIKKLWEAEKEKMTFDVGSITGDGGGAGQWRSLVEAVLKELGVFSAANVSKVLTSIQQESGGNRMAVNRTDSNAARGTPSMGLNQVIQPTFNANAGKYRHRGAFDPYANVYASVVYAMRRYGGSWANVMARPGGYDAGGFLPEGFSVAYNGTGKPEPVLTNNQWKSITDGKSSDDTDFDIDVYIHDDYVEAVIKRHGEELARKFKAGRKVYR